MTNIPPEIQSYKRTAWKPIIIEGDGALTASKFAGKPWLGKHEKWPKCPLCQNPLELFVQLNLNQLPEALQNEFGSGILQIFYCTNQFGCNPSPHKIQAFSDAHLIRIIQPERKKQRIEIPKNQDFFPPKLIVDWQKLEDYSNSEAASEFGIELNDELYEDNFPIEGDKLAAWPL
ncbi:hypothetical protein AFK68_12115 [Hydrocoleum sp. CS-953]|uniref:DUF1963 domain-containing protein n=1 Tax=Hydrocoleum sp. CS-953 TaxID=1671698 RepID=UPI000BC70512|nr:DUF1963 domain-containing protein [Hydrocoleum sp. CS-953]OZH54248.1 hypothetical protein AFK68_12115 [Hydrocoleum sp. CS-953]